MQKADIAAAYKRIKAIGRHGSEPGRSTHAEYEQLTDAIYEHGTRQQKGALSRLLKSWGDDEQWAEQAYGGTL
jgi:hypothetical protein